jgi:UDP-N-acetylglucosamine 1-carboxyvinyltransferase
MKFIIKGGQSLEGNVTIRGAKNAATKAMIASLLTDQPVTLRNFPFIGDTDITQELCERVGAHITQDRASSAITLHTPTIARTHVTSLSRRNRLPILALGPLLARVGKAEVPFLGGDKIGPRPVDLHIKALEALGARVDVSHDTFTAEAPNGLSGAHIHFSFPSVGATENAILAAVLAKGRTVLENAATEPEVVDLIMLLQKMGAVIELGANRTIHIEGVASLGGAVHALVPDRNEAISFAVLGMATRGKVRLEGVSQDHLITFLNVVRKIGGEFEVEPNAITFFAQRPFTGIELETDTHPGFMTDWQQPTVVLLTQAKGTSIIHETIYEDRFGYVQDLNDMGARIVPLTKCLGELTCRFSKKGHYHSAIVHGPTPLKGSTLKVRDLRSGMAHVIAALIAEGESVIEGVEEIDRGYHDLDGRLKALGANISRIT